MYLPMAIACTLVGFAMLLSIVIGIAYALGLV